MIRIAFVVVAIFICSCEPVSQGTQLNGGEHTAATKRPSCIDVATSDCWQGILGSVSQCGGVLGTLVDGGRCESVDGSLVVFRASPGESGSPSLRFTIGGGRGQRQCLSFIAGGDTQQLHTAAGMVRFLPALGSVEVSCATGEHFTLNENEVRGCEMPLPLLDYDFQATSERVLFSFAGLASPLWSCESAQPMAE